MEPDDDLAKLLPDAPPRPERREAAIAEAMRRFDGEKPAPSLRTRPQWAWPSWLQLGRPQLGALMSAAVVAVVGVPLALMVVSEQQASNPPVDPAAASQIATALRGSGAAPQVAPKVESGDTAEERVAPAASIADKEESRTAGSVARNEPVAPVLAPAPAPAAAPVLPPAPPPPPPPAPPAVALAERSAAPAAPSTGQNAAGIVVTGSRMARQDFSSNSPVTTVDAKSLAKSSGSRAAEEDDESPSAAIVITGSRISASAARAARRGDWNACTVNDPARSLERCKREVGADARGDAGRAGARIADGLTKAWAGDIDGSIADFDGAIAIRPRLAFAYLNRGMAYARLGEAERAIEDFDKAIDYAPYEARIYYQRSLALSALDKDSRAISDAERAISLNRQYDDLFE